MRGFRASGYSTEAVCGRRYRTARRFPLDDDAPPGHATRTWGRGSRLVAEKTLARPVFRTRPLDDNERRTITPPESLQRCLIRDDYNASRCRSQKRRRLRESVPTDARWREQPGPRLRCRRRNAVVY